MLLPSLHSTTLRRKKKGCHGGLIRSGKKAFSGVLWGHALKVRTQTWVSVFYEHFQEEGKPAPRILIPKLDGSIFDSESMNGKNREKKGLVLVFWATWCPPCEVELKRINNLIQQGEVPADSVIAISIQEDPNLVARAAKDRDYKFQIAVSFETTLARQFKVAGTPTIISIDPEKKIRWISSGLSPFLEFRIKNFLKN